MILRLPTDITNAPWYPQGREFTPFEARMDFMLCRGMLTPSEAGRRWLWPEERVCELFEVLKAEHSLLPKEEMYEKEENFRAVTEDIIRIFNQTFDKAITITDDRIKTVRARIKDGKNQDPPIGPNQFRAVFKHMKSEWEGDEKMSKHLVWETLTRKSNFQKYLDAAREAYQKRNKQATAQPGLKLEGAIKPQVLPNE